MFPLNVSTIGLPKTMMRRWWKVTRVTFIWLVFPLTLTAIVFLILLFATYQAHRLLTSGLKAHKVVHASLGSRFGQQDLYLPILIEILMIYFFQYGSFGGSVCTGCRWNGSPHTFYTPVHFLCVVHKSSLYDLPLETALYRAAPAPPGGACHPTSV